MKDRAYDPERLKSLIHYVIWAAGARPNFGAVKLYKILWFSDARLFVLRGQSITGAPYIREKYGPIPRDGIKLRNQLADAGHIRQWQNKASGHLGWHFRSLVPPAVSWLREDEKVQVTYWIKNISENHTAESISDDSHDYGWSIARMGEKLPFFSILAERIREPNSEELEWAKKRSKELGLP
jgi:hypothetical protein